VLVVVVLTIGLLALSHALDQLINVLDLRATSNLARLDRAVAGEPESSWIWMLLGLALAPGIGEEIFFRGLVQRGLGPWLGRAGALLATSAAFGAIHRDPVHSAGAFFLGLYLGLVADRTGGTRAAIGCHVLNNMAAVAGVALPPQQAVHPLVLAAVGLALAAGALAITGRWLRPERAPETALSEEP
jgi:membrane protease YdiL (CAAX protease family)